jgi:hypothetical protein
VVGEALSARGGKLAEVRLSEASLEGGVLTLKGSAPCPGLDDEVKAVCTDALAAAGLGPVSQVQCLLVEPFGVIREALARKFGKEVLLRGARLEGGRLVLEGEVSKHEYKPAAREEAARALEAAGLGPVTDWDTPLRKR